MSWDSPLWARVQRAAMTAVLLTLMVWGLRARPLALTSPPPAVSPAPALIVAALCAVGATVLVALAVHHPRRRRRGGEPEHVVAIPSTRWDRLQALTAVVVVFLLLAFVLWAAVHLVGGGTGSGQVTPTPAPSGVMTGTGAPGTSASAWLPDVLVVLFLLAAAGLILGSALRRRAHTDRSAPPAPSTARPEHPGPWKPRPGGDSREDVIGAFRVFEEAAARLGVPVDPPETAVDIAQHPVTVKSADPHTIADLTALFHRARYSSETITDADQDRAQVLLTRIRAQLGRPS